MLELLLFGTIEVKVGGAAPRNLSTKGRLLLAFLALNAGRSVGTGAIADAIFPDSRAEDPHDLVKKTASELRRLLGDQAGRLSSPAPRRLSLDLDGAEVDWLAFKSAIRRGDAESLHHAVALHTRPLLDMEPHAWAIPEQENCLRLRQQALETLFDTSIENGDLESAGSRLMQMLTFELPDVTIRETHWRAMFEALLTKQEYGKIQLHYGRLQTFLANTAGRAPEPETQALYNRIPKSILLHLAVAGNRKKRYALPSSARLPYFPSALIGRDKAKRDALALLKTARLVTVVGIGGVGKTRFAAQVGHEASADFRDEVGFVDLTSSRPDVVLQTVANALGVKEIGNRPLIRSLLEFLSPRRMLLVIDNCEHCVQETAGLVTDLMRGCPDLRLLLTSRQMLFVDGEQVFPLSPLALPERRPTRSAHGDRDLAFARTQESPAVRLFVERAGAVVPDFRLTEQNADVIADLCRLVDGLPLGIEMVASQTTGVPLERIAADLSRSALVLRNSKRAVLPRHQTLHATLDWSYGTLTAAEGTLLRRLSVFSGGWTLEAAENICADEVVPRADIASVLAELAAKSLVVIERTDPDAPPYRFLETIRAYAAELLLVHGEVRRLEEAHAGYYLQVLSELDDLSRIKEYLIAADRSRSNLYAAMQRSLVNPEWILLGHRIGMALHTYWCHRALSSEGRERHRNFLRAGADALPREAIAASMLEISEYSAGQGQGGSEEAMACQRRATEIYRELGDRKGESDVSFAIGMRLAYQQHLLEAYAHFEKVSEYCRETDHPYMVAYLLILMSGCLHDVRNDETCAAMYAEALEIARAKRLPSLEGLAHMSMGERAHRAGLLELAEGHFACSVAAYSGIDSRWGTVRSMSQLAEVKRQQGDFGQAQKHLHACLTQSCEFSNRRETLYLLAVCARLLHARKDWAAGLSLAAGLFNLSDTYPDELHAFREEFQTAIREASEHLNKSEAEAMLLGARMADFDTLLDYTLGLLEETPA